MGYIKNLKDSFKYVIADTADEYVPQIKNASLTMYDAARSLRSNSASQNGIRSVVKSIAKLPFINEISLFTKNSFEALKTGKLYGEVGMGFDDNMDLSQYDSLLVSEDYEGDDYGYDDSSGKRGNGDEPIISNDAKFESKVMYDTAKAQTDSLVNAMVRNHIDTKLHMTKINTDMVAGFGNITESVSSLVDFNNNVMRQWADQSIQYYTDSMAVLNDIKKAMHVMSSDEDGNNKKGGSWVDMMNGGKYKDALSDIMYRIGNQHTAGMFSTVMGMLPMLIGLYAMNPGGVVLDFFKSKMDDKFGTGGLKKISNKISNIGDYLNDLTENALWSDNKHVASTARAMRDRTYEKKDIKPEFKKGAVAWDNTSKTTLEVVIPGLLTKIAAGVTGMQGEIYDMVEQKWRTSDDIVKSFHAGRPKADTQVSRVKSLLRNNTVVGKVDPDKMKHGKIYVKSEDIEMHNTIIENMVKGMLDSGYTLTSIASGMKYKDFLSLFSGVPNAEKVVTPQLFNQIRAAIGDIRSTEYGNETYETTQEGLRDYMKRNNRYWADRRKESVERGYIHIANNMPNIMPNGGVAKGKGKNKGNAKMATFDDAQYLDDQDTSKLEKMIEKKVRYAVSESEAEQKLSTVHNMFTQDELDKLENHNINTLDMLHATMKRGFTQNDFMKKFKDSKLGKMFTGGTNLEIDSVLNGTVDNPFVKKLVQFKKFLKDEVKDKIGVELNDEQGKKVDKVADETLKGIDDEIKKINNNPNLSEKEKREKKESILRSKMSGALGALKSIFGGAVSFSGDKDSKAKMGTAAKIVLAGVGGIMGAGILGKLLKKIPPIGMMMGSFGFLTPLFLTGIGLAGGIWAYKSGILDGILGKFKDPEQRKEMMGKFFKNTLPSALGGIALGAATNMVLGGIPVFGPVLGPLMGAGIGLGAAVYSYKNKLFEGLFGKKEGKEGDKKDGKKIVNMITAGITSGAGAMATAGILKMSSGLTLGAGGLLGGIVGSPIILASAAVAGGLLLEKDNIKKRIFGDGAEDHSFVKNLGMWLFGDKESNKEGLLSRQMKKFGDSMTKAGDKINDWFKLNIVENIKIGFKPFTEAVGGIGKNIVASLMGGWDKMSDKMQDAMDKGFFKSLSTVFEEKVIDPISAKLNSFFGFMFNIVGKIIAAPFKMFAKGFGGRTATQEDVDASDAKVKAVNDEATIKQIALGGTKHISDSKAKLLERLGIKRPESTIDEDGLTTAQKKSVERARRKAEKAERKSKKDESKQYVDFWSNANTDSYESRANFGSGAGTKKYGKKILSSLFGKGGETFFNQNDSTWSKLSLGDSTVGDAGCGLAAIAMLVSHFRGRKITPKDLLPIAQRFKVRGDGIAPAFFEEVAKTYYLDYELFQAGHVNPDTLLDSIKSGNRVVALLHESYNRSSKHYIYMHSVKDKHIVFSDPLKSGKESLDYLVLHSYARQYAVFSSREITGEKVSTKRASVIERIKAKVSSSKKGDLTDARNEEEARIKKINDMVASDSEEKESSKDMGVGGFTKGGILTHIRSLDKVVRKIYNDIHSNRKNHKSTSILARVIQSQTNGVAYNLEYIKRIMIKHLGDLGTGEKPGTDGKYANFKIKKYHPILNFFSDIFGWGKDKVWDGVTSIFDLGRLVMDKATDLIFHNPIIEFFTGKIKTIMNFFTDTLPSIITKPFEIAGKIIGEATTGIITGIMDIKDGVFGLVKDIWTGVKTVFGDIYTVVSSAVKSGVGFMGHLLLGMGKFGYDTLVNSKFGQKVIGGIGDFISGALGGGGGLLSSIGGFLKNTKEAAFGPQKVFVVGGKLEMIDRITSINAVGTVDMDAVKAMNAVSDPAKTLADKEANVNDANSTSKTTSEAQTEKIASAGEVAKDNKTNPDKNEELKKEDKEQDKEDKDKVKRDSYWKRLMDRMYGDKKGNTNQLLGGAVTQNPENGKYGGPLGWLFNIGKGVKGLGLGALKLIGGLAGGALGLGALGNVAGHGLSFLGNSTPLKYIPGVKDYVGGAGDWMVDKTDAASGMITQNDTISDALGVDKLSDAANTGHAMRASRFILNKKYGLNKAMAEGLTEAGAKRVKEITKLVSTKQYAEVLKKNGARMVYDATSKTTKMQLIKDVTKPSVIERALNMLFRNRNVETVMAKHGVVMTKSALKELAEVAAKNGAKKSSILSVRIGANFIPYANIIVAAGFFAYDLISGMWTADKLFRVKKSDVTWKMRVVAGLVKSIQGLVASTGILFIVGLIPVEWIIDWTKKFFFSDEEIQSLEKKRMAKADADKKEAIKNIKDPAQRKAAEEEDKRVREEEKSALRASISSKGGPKNGVYYQKGELTEQESNLLYNDALEGVIKGKKKTAVETEALRRFFDEHVENEDKKKEQKKTWTGKLSSADLVSDYMNMQPFTKDKDAMLVLNRARAFDYTFANGYTYSEIGCIPESLANVYESMGLTPNRMDMAMTADYYANYINGGKGVPMAYAIDYAVMDGLGVKNLKSPKDIDAELAAGNRLILLTKYNGSDHAVAITGRTENGGYIMYDSLRQSGPILIDRKDPVFRSISSGMAIGGGERKGYDYYLYDNPEKKLASPTFKWDDLGNFANSENIAESKAWSKIQFTRGNAGKKPKDYSIITDAADSTVKAIGMNGLTSELVKSKIARDVYNDNNGTWSYGTVRTKGGKALVGTFKTTATGPVIDGSGNATFVDESGTTSVVPVDMNYYSKSISKKGFFGTSSEQKLINRSADFAVSSLKSNATLGGFGVYNNGDNGYNALAINSVKNHLSSSVFGNFGNHSREKKLKNATYVTGDEFNNMTAQGPVNINTERHNLLLNKKLDEGRTLNSRLRTLNAIGSIQKSKVIYNNTQGVTNHVSERVEVIKTQNMEALLFKMLEALNTLISVTASSGANNISMQNMQQQPQTQPQKDYFLEAIGSILEGKTT